MGKYKVIITKTTVCEIEIEAVRTDEAVEKLKELHEKAGRRVKPFKTQELRADVYKVYGKDEGDFTTQVRAVRLI
jgi:hypothetical protein